MILAVSVYGVWLAPAVLAVLLVAVGFELDLALRRLSIRRRNGRRGGWLL